MKKSLIALAALAAVSAVSAQSTVSVYGRLDLGYSSANQTNAFGLASSSASAFQSQASSATTLGNQNGRTTSRLGFSGVEDLGGGLKAMFNYEVALAPDNIGTKIGSNDKAFAEMDNQRVGFGGTRLANIGVSGGFGTVVLGTFLNAHDTLRGYNVNTFAQAGGDFIARHNANHADAGTAGATFTAAAIAHLGNKTQFDGGYNADATGSGARNTALALKGLNGVGFNGRSHNAVAYSSPVISGFSVGVGVQADKSSRTGTAAADVRNIDGQTVSLSYANGPLKATFVTGNAKVNDPDATSTSAYQTQKAKDQGFAVNYNFGFADVFLVTEGVNASVAGGLLAGYKVKTNATEIGAKFPMGALTPYIALASGKITINPAGTESAYKTSGQQMGALYDLSKRSYMYAAYGTDKMMINGSGLSRDGFTLGLVHSF